MGYPFDKTWARRVNSTDPVPKIIDGLPHVKLYDFKIYRYTKLYQGDHSKPPPKTDITWENTIKGFFTPRDVDCMKKNGNFDLSDKKSVEVHAGEIYNMLSTGKMPPESSGEKTWSKEKLAQFEAWMNSDFP